MGLQTWSRAQKRFFCEESLFCVCVYVCACGTHSRQHFHTVPPILHAKILCIAPTKAGRKSVNVYKRLNIDMNNRHKIIKKTGLLMLHREETACSTH